MAFSWKAFAVLLILIHLADFSSETLTRLSAITSDPSQGTGIVYCAEGSSVALLWRYYVPVIEELSEISITHNERHAVRFFRIRASPNHVTNITAVYPPFPQEAFVNDMENMTAGLIFPMVNRSMAGNYTLSIVYSNIATPAAHQRVILYVAAAPSNVRVLPSYRYPLVRSQLEIQCFATSTSVPSFANHGKPMLFRWFHNGMTLSNDLVPPPFLAEGQMWVSKLVIPAVGEAHAGGYACQAEELGLSAISSTVRITVVGFPAMLQRPFPALAGRPLMLTCQPHMPVGLAVECTSLNVRLTCNGKQLHALTFPTLLPLYDQSRLRSQSRRSERNNNNMTEAFAAVATAANATTIASVDYTFDVVSSDLNGADCLCIVKYNKKPNRLSDNNNNNKLPALNNNDNDDNNSTILTIAGTTTTPSSRSSTSELLSSMRLVVLYPPDDVQLVADPPFPWLVPQSEGDYDANNKTTHQDNMPSQFRLICTVGVIGNPKNLYFSWPSEQSSRRQLSQPNAWTSVLDLSKYLQPAVDNLRLVQCQTNNDAGNGPLAQVRLVVYGSPRVSVVILPNGQLVEPSQLVEFREGAPLSLRCLAAVSGATPQPQHYIWRRDGILLSTDSQDLVIPSVNAGHAGRYQCEVVIDTHTSSVGVIMSGISFRLAVIYINLSVDALKPSEVIVEGDNVTLFCKADGYPLSEITFDPWLFEPTVAAFSPTGEYIPNSRPIPGSLVGNSRDPSRTVEVFENAFREEDFADPVPLEMSLFLSNVQPSDSGKYWCSASNQLMLTRRRFIAIDVHFKPRLNAILSSPSTVPVRIGQKVVLLAAVSANPLPDEFEWLLLNGRLQRPELVPPTWVIEHMSPTVSQLVISSLSPSDLQDGPLEVAIRVRNVRGQSMFRFSLVARGPPSDPSSFRVLRSWPTSILLAFQPGFDGGQPQYFQIICMPQSDNQSLPIITEPIQHLVVVQDPGYGKTARVSVEDLQPSTSYKCSLEGIASRPLENDSSLLLMPASILSLLWKTTKLFVNSKTIAMPLINFTSVEWILSASPPPPPSLTNSSSTEKQHSVTKIRHNDIYLLNQLCFTISCTSHQQECNSKYSKLMRETDKSTWVNSNNNNNTIRSFQTNLAGMRFATEVMICWQKKIGLEMQFRKATTESLKKFDECWISTTNYTVQIWEQRSATNDSSASASQSEEEDRQHNQQQVCLVGHQSPPAASNSTSMLSPQLFVSDLLPQVASPLLVSIRLFSLMDGDLVATLPNTTFSAPFLQFNADEDESGDFSEVDRTSVIFTVDGLLSPLIGTVLGVVLVFSFVGLVALIACSAARHANKSGSVRHRMSLSTSGSTTNDTRTMTGIYGLSSSPTSSSTENGVATSSKTVSVASNSSTTVRNGGTAKSSSKDRIVTAFSTDSSRRRSADFQWADFRQNPLLSSVGVATTGIASDYSAASLRCRREERIITCVNGVNTAQLFGGGGGGGGGGDASYVTVSSLRKQPNSAVINTVPEHDPIIIDDPSNFRSPNNSSNSDSNFQCVDGFEVQQQQRRRLSTSDMEGSLIKKSIKDDKKGGVIEDTTISPPPRYTTLYSRLADLKPCDRSVVSSSNSAATTQYARLDFVKMANLGSFNIAINATSQEPKSSGRRAGKSRKGSSIHSLVPKKSDDMSSFH